MEDNFWEILIGSFDVKLLVFVRILGAFAFVPILSRNNFPAMARVGVSIFITYIVTLTMGAADVDTGGTIGTYVFSLLREAFIGLVIGFIMDMFILTVQVAGDVMDSQAGIGMAKMFDPGTRIQMSVFGTFISFLIYMYFFVTNSHMTLVNIFVTSFEIIPVGQGQLNYDLGWIIADFFNQILLMVLKLAMPVITSEMLLHFCMGILMKTVPQIQVMIINMQLMCVLGFLMLFAIAAPMAEFVDTYIADMLESVQNIIPQIFTLS